MIKNGFWRYGIVKYSFFSHHLDGSMYSQLGPTINLMCVIQWRQITKNKEVLSRMGSISCSFCTWNDLPFTGSFSSLKSASEPKELSSVSESPLSSPTRFWLSGSILLLSCGAKFSSWLASSSNMAFKISSFSKCFFDLQWCKFQCNRFYYLHAWCNIQTEIEKLTVPA